MVGAEAQTLNHVVKTTFFLMQYGRNALEIVMKSIVNLDSPMVSPPPDFPGDFFKGNFNPLDLITWFWSFCRIQKMQVFLELENTVAL